MNHRLRRWGAVIAVIGAAGLAITACSAGGSGSSSSAAAPTTFTLATKFNLAGGFDPASPTSSVGANSFLAPVYDTLLRWDSSGELVPDLAEDWSYDQTRTTLTMHLRDDVTFSDATAFDATVVKANIDRAKALPPSPAGANVASITDVAVVDPHTVQFHLAQPDAGLLENLANSTGMMIAPSALDPSWDLATKPVGSGAYIYDASQSIAGDTYTYHKNPDYWDPDRQNFETVVVKIIEDPVAKLNAIRSGQVDAADITSAQVPQADSAGLTVQTADVSAQGLILFDRDGTKVPALGDPRVRQAINYALDRKAILDASAWAGNGTVTSQPFGIDSTGYLPELDDYYDYDPAKAKQLLAEAGYPDGFTLETPDLRSVSDEAVFAGVQQQLADVGITMNYIDGSLSVSDIFQRSVMGEYAGAVGELGTGTSWQTVSTYIAPFASFNTLKTTRPEVNELLGKISLTTGDDQDAAYQDLNRYVVEEGWFAPFFRTSQTYVTNPKFTLTITPATTGTSVFDYAPAK